MIRLLSALILLSGLVACQQAEEKNKEFTGYWKEAYECTRGQSNYEECDELGEESKRYVEFNSKGELLDIRGQVICQSQDKGKIRCGEKGETYNLSLSEEKMMLISAPNGRWSLYHQPVTPYQFEKVKKSLGKD